MSFDCSSFEDDVIALFRSNQRENKVDQIKALQSFCRLLASGIAEYNALQRAEEVGLAQAMEEGHSTAEAAVDSLDVLVWAFVDGNDVLQYQPEKFETAYINVMAPVTARLIRELSQPDTSIEELSAANIQGILAAATSAIMGPVVYPIVKSLSDEEKQSLCDKLAEGLRDAVLSWVNDSVPYLTSRFESIRRKEGRR